MSKREYRTFAEMLDEVLRSLANAIAEVGRKAEEKHRHQRALEFSKRYRWARDEARRTALSAAEGRGK